MERAANFQCKFPAQFPARPAISTQPPGLHSSRFTAAFARHLAFRSPTLVLLLVLLLMALLVAPFAASASLVASPAFTSPAADTSRAMVRHHSSDARYRPLTTRAPDAQALPEAMPDGGPKASALQRLMDGFDYEASSAAEVEACAAAIFGELRRERRRSRRRRSPSRGARRCCSTTRCPTRSQAVVGKVCRSNQLVDDDGCAVGDGTSTSEQAAALRDAMVTAFGTPRVLRGVVADLLKVLAVDPAAEGLLQPLLFFKGFHALATYRVAHTLWCGGGTAQMGAALMLQSRASSSSSTSTRRRRWATA